MQLRQHVPQIFADLLSWCSVRFASYRFQRDPASPPILFCHIRYAIGMFRRRRLSNATAGIVSGAQRLGHSWWRASSQRPYVITAVQSGTRQRVCSRMLSPLRLVAGAVGCNHHRLGRSACATMSCAKMAVLNQNDYVERKWRLSQNGWIAFGAPRIAFRAPAVAFRALGGCICMTRGCM